MLPRLNGLFRDHTFFVDSEGLNILEPIDEPVTEGTQTARVVNVANWSDENLSSVAAHEPSRLTPLSNLGSNSDFVLQLEKDAANTLNLLVNKRRMLARSTSQEVNAPQ